MTTTAPTRKLEQVELLGTDLVPVLRKEMEPGRTPRVPDAPTHASLVKAKYGEDEPRQPRPKPSRGDVEQQIADHTWSSYQHQFAGNATRAERTAVDGGRTAV